MCQTTRSRIIDAIFYDTYVYNIIIVFINVCILFFLYYIFLHDTLVCNVLLFFLIFTTIYYNVTKHVLYCVQGCTLVFFYTNRATL